MVFKLLQKTEIVSGGNYNPEASSSFSVNAFSDSAHFLHPVDASDNPKFSVQRSSGYRSMNSVSGPEN